MKSITLFRSLSIILFCVILFAGCSKNENPIAPSDRFNEEVNSLTKKSSDNNILTGEPEKKFRERFEGDLSNWIGKHGGEHHAIIVDDPIRPQNHVVTFTQIDYAGDIFSPEITLEPGDVCELSFEYLGILGPGCVPDNLGGAIGFSDQFVEINSFSGRFLAATDLGTPNSGIDDDPLIDDGKWHKYKIKFDPFESGYRWYDGSPENNTIRVTLEDWLGAGGVAGDVFFDDIVLKVKHKKAD
jgi:hypothetical protein